MGLPRFENRYPVLETQKVNDRSRGEEALAKTIGAVADESIKTVEEIETNKSQAMYVHAVANIEQAKTNSQIRLLKNPEQASRIEDDMDSSIDAIRTNAYVNSADRSKLDAYASMASQNIALKAVETDVRQSKIVAGTKHFMDFPDQLKAHQDLLLHGQDEEADQLQESMITNIKNLALTGAITPKQAGTSMEMLGKSVDNVGSYFKYLGNSETTARDYHTLISSPINRGRIDNAGTPSNESTNWLMQHHNDDQTIQNIQETILSDKKLPFEAFSKLSYHQQVDLQLTSQGKQQADGIINSNEPFPSILKESQLLSTQEDTVSKAKKKTLDNYISDLTNGNYLQAIARTSQGGAIMQNFVNKNAAINSNYMDASDREAALAQNKNDMMQQAVAYGYAHHIPDEYIKPMSAVDLTNMENGFKLNQDPMIVLKTLGQYSKTNQAYVANSMATPSQRLITQALSNVDQKIISPTEQLDLITANQGRSYHEISYPDKVHDSTLSARIGSNLTKQQQLLKYQYGADGETLTNSMVETTLNLAKYLAYKNGDLGMSNWSKWTDQASKIYQNSFQAESGVNYMVNANQLPPGLTTNDLSTLADYATHSAYESIHPGEKPAQFYAAQSANPLVMRITSTNNIEAVDQNGSVYFSQPYTMNILAHARKEAKTRQEQRSFEASKDYEKNRQMYSFVD